MPDFRTKNHNATPSSMYGHSFRTLSLFIVIRMARTHSAPARPDVEPARVEYGDNEHGAEIVDNGERREEHLHRCGDATSQQCEYAQGEGDLRCSRNRPAATRLVIAGIDRNEDERRNCHATGGGGPAQDSARSGGQLPIDHFPLDLSADQQEEQRH